ncbi:hypothetical protein BGZ49_010056 [Haplosporangium sp. Z 27]|nr:hypothetical protein BGZ49_010056 [Haplosporangium sp. Z 27]
MKRSEVTKGVSIVLDGYEDIFAHSTLDTLFATISLVKGGYELVWASRPADDSRGRRGNGLKPDVTILKSCYELAFIKIKPPKEDHDPKPCFEDLWKFANYCKDSIDTRINLDSDFVVKAAAVQIFSEFCEIASNYILLDACQNKLPPSSPTSNN